MLYSEKLGLYIKYLSLDCYSAKSLFFNLSIFRSDINWAIMFYLVVKNTEKASSYLKN